MRLAALLFLSSAAMAQQNPDRVRSKVLDDMRRVPRYTCTQTIERAEYRPQYDGRPEGCDALIGARAKLPSPGYVTWHDRLRGRILRLEQYLFPVPRWMVALRFETIEHNGVEQPLDLMPVKGDGVFTFPGRGNLVLDQKFHSEWETR